jgi:hypothetical protein
MKHTGVSSQLPSRRIILRLTPTDRLTIERIQGMTARSKSEVVRLAVHHAAILVRCSRGENVRLVLRNTRNRTQEGLDLSGIGRLKRGRNETGNRLDEVLQVRSPASTKDQLHYLINMGFGSSVSAVVRRALELEYQIRSKTGDGARLGLLTGTQNFTPVPIVELDLAQEAETSWENDEVDHVFDESKHVEVSGVLKGMLSPLFSVLVRLVSPEEARDVAIAACKDVTQLSNRGIEPIRRQLLCRAVELVGTLHQRDSQWSAPPTGGQLERAIQELSLRHRLALLARVHGWLLDDIAAALRVPQRTAATLSGEAIAILRRRLHRPPGT